MKVFLTCPPVSHVHPWEGPAFVRRATELFEASTDRRGHELAGSAAEADVVLYLEPNAWRDRPYAEAMLREDDIRRWPEKCFAYNYADFFIGFLPGLYVGLPKWHATDPRYASWSYVLGLPNPFVARIAEQPPPYQPKHLFSFRGTNTAPVRGEILRRGPQWGAFASVGELPTGQFYRGTEELQRRYVDEVLASRFVLCPRGLGSSSHRLFETMALGRVPVILSDAWVEPAGPAWRECSLRVPEEQVARLPEILRQAEPRAAEMGRKARAAWEQWFAPGVVVPRCFDRLAEIVARQSRTPPDYARLWRSARFYAPYGLAPHQRLWRNVKNGQLLKKLSRRLAGRGGRQA